MGSPAPSRRQGVNVKTRPLDFERAAACDSHTAALRQAYHAPASFARSTGMRKSVAQPQRIALHQQKKLGDADLIKVRDLKRLQAALDKLALSLGTMPGISVTIKKRTYRGVELREIQTQAPT